MLSELADVESALSDSPSTSVLERLRGVHVTSRSAEVRPGSIFIAIRGGRADGHDFLAEATSRGAYCAVVETLHATEPLPQIQAPNTRQALSRLISISFGSPSSELFCVAVTGTNGKTTTQWMISNILTAIGMPTLRIGTLGMVLPDGTILGETLTTPDAEDLYSALAAARDAGCAAAVMEASSHALAQYRLDDVSLDVAVFTNLTRDHLDYHQTFEAYSAAKERLFHLLARSMKKRTRAVVNVDNECGVRFAALCTKLHLPLVTYGRSGAATLRLLEIECSAAGSVLRVEQNGQTTSITSPYIGEHNAENLLAAIASVTSVGCEIGALLPTIAALPQVPGRLESVGDAELPIYVDYAHTPDALERALAALRPLVSGRLWVVFGCGGDRDRGKRPLMGEVALRLADTVVVTSDNPRTEDPLAIIDDILLGNAPPWLREVDRRHAIEAAVTAAGRGDAILIAGKGHEPYQIIGNERVAFSDAAEARKALSHRRQTEGVCSTFSG